MKKAIIFLFILILACYFGYKSYLLNKYTYHIPDGENYEKAKKMKIDFIDIKHKHNNDLVDLGIVKIIKIDLLKNHRIFGIKKILPRTRLYMLSNEVGTNDLDNIYGNIKLSEEEIKGVDSGFTLITYNIADKDYSLLEDFKADFENKYPEINVDKIIEKYNIKNEIDLLHKSYEYKNKKTNIFSSKEQIVEKFVFNNIYIYKLPLSKKMIFLKGDEYGIISISDGVRFLRLQKNDFDINFAFENNSVSEKELIEIASTIIYDYDKLNYITSE